MSRREATIDVFHAVSDATRRRILDLLVTGERTVTGLVSQFEISQPSISEHLRILREAGLVSVRRQGRQRIYSLLPMYLRTIDNWLMAYRPYLASPLNRQRQVEVQKAEWREGTLPIYSHMSMEID